MIFKSIKRGNKIGYSLNAGTSNKFEGFYNNPSRYVSGNIIQFETYGDGNTQHSSGYGVTVEDMKDCLASLAIHISKDQSCIPEIERIWPYEINRHQVRFLLTLKYNPDKDTYYNLADQKKSTHPSKRYDKRWEKLEDWFKGDAYSLFRIMRQSYWSVLDNLVSIRSIREVIAEMIDRYDDIDYKANLNIEIDTVLRQAIDAIVKYVEGYKNAKHADGIVDCVISNWKVEEEKTN